MKRPKIKGKTSLLWALSAGGLAALTAAILLSRGSTQTVAHRAGAAQGPENTIAALERAIAAGADTAEIDVRETRDGVLVVLHDSTLSRTAGLNQYVWDTDYESLRLLDAGGWFSPDFAGEEIPTLEEMLQAARGRIRLMIELKETENGQAPLEHTISLIRAMDMEGQCMLASTDLSLLQRSKVLVPELKTVCIVPRLSLGACLVDCVDAYSVESRWFTGGEVLLAHLSGKEIYIWTVNTAEEMERDLLFAPDGLVTDDPALARTIIGAGR